MRYERREGIEPYEVTALRAGSRDCEWCDEGAEIGEIHAHAVYMSREGAASRTADNLCATFLYDVAALTTYEIPDGMPSPDASEWCDDPDDSQALADEVINAESALADAGLSSYWNDGYVIEEIREATPDEIEAIATEAGTQHGINAGSWAIDGNTSEETARAWLRGFDEGDPATYDAMPNPPDYIADIDQADRLLIAALETDEGTEAYEMAFRSACEEEIYRAALALLPEARGAYVHIEATMRNDSEEYSRVADRWAMPSSLDAHEINVTEEDEDEYGIGIPVRVVTLSGIVTAEELDAFRSEWSLDPSESEPNLGFLGDLGDGIPRCYESERYSFGGMDFNVGGWTPVLDVTVSIVGAV